jgi:hypothetical protein
MGTSTEHFSMALSVKVYTTIERPARGHRIKNSGQAEVIHDWYYCRCSSQELQKFPASKNKASENILVDYLHPVPGHAISLYSAFPRRIRGKKLEAV